MPQKPIIIQNATIYDGTGDRPFVADVKIENGLIADVGLNLPAQDAQVVDGKGKILSPGFINTHSHSELRMFDDPSMICAVGQGITTEVLGQDGSSVIPVTDAIRKELQESMAPLCGNPPRPYWWNNHSEYMAAVETTDPACRFESLTGYGTVRMCVMGCEDRPPTPKEMDEICMLIAQELKAGSRGVSLGMVYPPCSYADKEEMITMAKVVAEHDGLIMVHTRNEMARLLESFEEMVDVMKGSGVRLEISHLKSLGKVSWGKVKIILKRMEELQAEGYDITFDQYPWTAGSTGMKIIAPGWAYSGGEDAFAARLEDAETYAKILVDARAELAARGNGECVQIASVPHDDWTWMCGLRLNEIARRMEMDEAECVLKLLKDSRSGVICIYHAINEDDVREVMRSPYHTLCTDGVVGQQPHPRAYSSYARFLGRYVRDAEILPLQTAIRNITYEPARRLRLWDRGLIRIGMSADMVLFDFNTIIDTNSYTDPCIAPDGICKVWVQGRLRYEGKQ